MPTKHVLTLLAATALSLLSASFGALAQDDDKSTDRRAALNVDRRAKHLFDKAIELMEYKQYDRGLTMLDTVIRDNEENILAYQAHMAKGRHFSRAAKIQGSTQSFPAAVSIARAASRRGSVAGRN